MPVLMTNPTSNTNNVEQPADAEEREESPSARSQNPTHPTTTTAQPVVRRRKWSEGIDSMMKFTRSICWECWMNQFQPMVQLLWTPMAIFSVLSITILRQQVQRPIHSKLFSSMPVRRKRRSRQNVNLIWFSVPDVHPRPRFFSSSDDDRSG